MEELSTPNGEIRATLLDLALPGGFLKKKKEVSVPEPTCFQ